MSRAPNGDLFLLHDVLWGNPPIRKEEELPPVVRVSSGGKFIGAWGGPDTLPSVNGISQFPDHLDGLDIDDEGNVWIGGYGPDDDAAVKFSPDGKFLMRIGTRGMHGTNDDTKLLFGPVSFYHDIKNREVFIADGYGNNRIIAFNSDTGEFSRMWGAYGHEPTRPSGPGEAAYHGEVQGSLPAIPPTFANPVHKIARAPDGRIDVCDRANNRVQEFELVPGGARFIREVLIAPGTMPFGTAWDIAFTPDGKYMYVADGSNSRVWIVDRQTFAVVGWTSAAPELEGTDNISIQRSPLHRMTIEPSGDLLLARTLHGLQRLKFLGIW